MSQGTGGILVFDVLFAPEVGSSQQAKYVACFIVGLQNAINVGHRERA